MREIALFSGKIYTPGTNFTRPPVVTVATNLNSAVEGYFFKQDFAHWKWKRIMISLYENIIHLLFIRYLLSYVINLLRSKVFQDYLKVLLWRCTLRPQLLLCVSNLLLNYFPTFLPSYETAIVATESVSKVTFLGKIIYASLQTLLEVLSYPVIHSPTTALRFGSCYNTFNGLAVSCGSFKHYAVPR